MDHSTNRHWYDCLNPRWIRRSFAGRKDSEHEQALIRAVIGLLVMLYVVSPFYAPEPIPGLPTGLHAVSLFFLFAMLNVVAIACRPQVSHPRRIVGMVADLGSSTYLLAVSGEYGVPMVVVYLWVTMGNGFRYGLGYLYASTAISLLGFAIASTYSEFWRQYHVVTTSVFIILLALPVYMATLLTKLNRAIERANEANRAKTRFLANMSHELRTPLNGVMGMSDLLMETPLSGEQKELGRTIQSSAHTLLQTIEQVLDISKIESGKLSLQRVDFDLHRLVNDTARMFNLSARKKGLEFSTHVAPETPFLLRGDAMHLRQILINLIGNAIKFTKEGQVEVTVGPVGDDGTRTELQFEILDTGIGMSETVQERIFESFTQADQSIGRRFGGTGLGTTISQQLVHLMGGTITLHSREGQGTRFVVRLPFERQISRTGAANRQRLPGTRVLLLLNEPNSRNIEQALKSWAVSFERVDSSVQMFSRLLDLAETDQAFTAALIDHTLLQTEPEQLGRSIRKDARLKPLSMVLVSDTQQVNIAACLQAGFSSVLRAPVDKTLLFNALHAASSEHESATNVVSLAQHYKSRSGASNLNVLVAEDNETNRRVLQGILGQAGHRTTLVDNGETALDLLNEDHRRYDLMILDMNMPERDGVEVLKALRFMEFDGSHVPTIMLTADATLEAERICRDAGADMHLTKPIDARRLLDCIAHLTHDHHSRPASMPDEPAAGGAPPRQRGGRASTTTLLVDETKLDSLARLGSGTDFIRELIGGFRRDSDRLLGDLETAVAEQDYRRFRDVLHAFRGSGIELGCQYLVAECQSAGQLKPFEIGGSKPLEMIERITRAYTRTCDVLDNYVNTRRDVR